MTLLVYDMARFLLFFKKDFLVVCVIFVYLADGVCFKVEVEEKEKIRDM